jgi:hypothetical protein
VGIAEGLAVAVDVARGVAVGLDVATGDAVGVALGTGMQSPSSRSWLPSQDAGVRVGASVGVSAIAGVAVPVGRGFGAQVASPSLESSSSSSHDFGVDVVVTVAPDGGVCVGSGSGVQTSSSAAGSPHGVRVAVRVAVAGGVLVELAAAVAMGVGIGEEPAWTRPLAVVEAVNAARDVPRRDDTMASMTATHRATNARRKACLLTISARHASAACAARERYSAALPVR